MSTHNDDKMVTPESFDRSIQEGLSPARLTPFLKETKDDLSRALDLYEWNSRLAAECFNAIGHLEVFLRNTLDRVLAEEFDEVGRESPWFDQTDRTDLLTKGDFDSVTKARSQLRQDKRPASRDRIVAELSFGFWCQLLGRNHDDLWRKALRRAFSDPSKGNKTPDRGTVFQLVDSIRRSRNRVAHHNYLNSFDIPKAMDEVLTLARMLSPTYAKWIEERSQWLETYQDYPINDADTVVVAAGKGAWELYKKHPIYICRAGRYIREKNIKYMAFYEGRVIHEELPCIRQRLACVRWNEQSAEHFATSDKEELRQLARAIRWSLSPEGQEETRNWGLYLDEDDDVQVFILTPYPSNKDSGDTEQSSPQRSARRSDGHIQLKKDIPHLTTGRGSAFTQKQRFVSMHRLASAASTDDLVDLSRRENA